MSEGKELVLGENEIAIENCNVTENPKTNLLIKLGASATKAVINTKEIRESSAVKILKEIFK